MTFEHRLLVGFDEIKAVVFECNECKTRTSIPVKEFNAPPLLCPKEHAWVTNKPVIEQMTALAALGSLLKSLRDEAFQERAKFRVFLEFEAKKLD